MSDLTSEQRQVVESIGEEYVEREHFAGEGSAEVREAYRNIAEINAHKFERMEREVEVVFTEDDPYSSFEEMKRKVAETGTMEVFSGGSKPPLMTHRENCVGRAVHDYYGHLDAGCDFSPEGEYTKWEHVRSDYSDDRLGIESLVMFAEVVGQLCAAFYLPDGFNDDRFEQRAFPAPTDWIEMFDMMFPSASKSL